eukprot:gene31474-40875_t
MTTAEIREYWQSDEKESEHEYLKDVLGDKALEWVKSVNDHCLQLSGNPKDSLLYNKILSILDSKDKIPYITKIFEHYYNFWQDENHPRDPEWEVVLDFDALGAAEGESWVYKGSKVYDVSEDQPDRLCLIMLSRGGADAVVTREFDLKTLKFLSETDQGFVLPECKSRVSYKTRDILLIGTDLHDGESMTDSGYPRVVREWKRGTPLDSANAVKVFEGEATDVAVSGYMSRHGNFLYEMRRRSITFYTAKSYIALYSVATGENEWHELQLQPDALVGQFRDQLIVSLRSDWEVKPGLRYGTGSLLVVSIKEFVDLGPQATFFQLFAPTETCSMETYTVTKDFIILQLLDCVKNRYVFWNYDVATATWVFTGQEPEAVIGGGYVSAVDENESNLYWLTTSSFIQPSTLSLGDASLGPSGVAAARPLKSLPPQFDASDLVEKQFFATSEDGTSVPYFLICNKDLVFDGSNPTILYGYGGFEISMTPAYSAIVGSCWLNEKKNCYVLANIRGGGEFGPRWHQAAKRENRKLAYDDFIAVAEDLIKKQITTSKKLAIRGGSNGGLLMGNMFTRRPDLFGAVHCLVPLLDMRSYNKLLAGASWMAEYGDPDKPEDWAFLQKYSAYHNLNPAKTDYPPLLMTTSTRDDRVHPYHARSFVKRLLDIQQANGKSDNQSVLYFENIEGGHGGAADNKQQAFMNVLYLEFFKKIIG